MRHNDSDRSNAAAVAYFDAHADYYDRNQYRSRRRTFMNGRHDTIVRYLGDLALPPGARVLDAGCGPGNLLVEFAKRSGTVFALDASPRMLQVARSHTEAVKCENVRFHVGSITALPFADASFDLVCSAGVIEYLDSPDAAIGEFHRVLKPGGILLLPTTNVLAPAHWLRPVLEPISRLAPIARMFGLQPGGYRLRYSYLPRFKKRLRTAGLVLEHERHFYLTLPRPLDRMLPQATRQIERLFDSFMTTALRHFAEGYLAIAIRPESDRSPRHVVPTQEL